MLFVEGAAPAKRLPLRLWKMERKIAQIAAFNAAEAATQRSRSHLRDAACNPCA